MTTTTAPIVTASVVRQRAAVLVGVAACAAVLLLSAAVARQFIWPSPERLLGIELPPSVANMDVELQHQAFSEYRGYLRFELAPQEVATLLDNLAFQGVTKDDDPFARMDNASIGQVPLAHIAQRERPAWWNPQPDRTYALAYRSRLGPGADYTGSDAVWYMIDGSDPERAIVYVYLIEV